MTIRRIYVSFTLVSLWFGVSSCSGTDSMDDPGGQIAAGDESADSELGVVSSELSVADTDSSATARASKRIRGHGWRHAWRHGWRHHPHHGSGGCGGGVGGSGSGATGGTTGSGGGGGELLTGVETPTPPCTVPDLPPYSELSSNPKLPDPFTLMDGTEVATTEQWACRRAEILAQLSEYELGPKPPKPSSVTGSLSGNTLTINVSEGGKSISFPVTISKPSGPGPFPAVIAYSTPCVPVPSSVATILVTPSLLAADAARGEGKFYDLYGSSHEAGAMMAWAWGVSRVIDALEVTPEAGINTQRIAITGCSRYGKGALVAGAYDARIALTLPQESGSGGAGCWRVVDYQVSNGETVQTIASATSEAPWFTSSFVQFADTATKLPFDHHMLAGLVAPRGLLVIDNTALDWLGDISCYTCGVAARRIWDALGVSDSMGYSQVYHGSHCVLPSAQQPELTAYLNKFLLDDSSGDTDVLKTDGGFTFDEELWVDWDTPDLE